jgi:hypothetical protein
MPFHVEEVNSDITVIEGELPLSPAQVEKLVQLVMKRMEEKHRDTKLSHEASSIERHVAPPLRVGD